MVALIFISCNQEVKKEFSFETLGKEKLNANHVKSKKEIWIKLNDKGESVWSKIYSTRIFNNEGLCALEIFPHYKMPEISPNISALEKLDLFSYGTNIQTNISDTTFYTYDNNANLVEKVERKYNDFNISFDVLTNYKYDNFDNLIEKCSSSETTQTFCSYSQYVYEKNKKIKYKVDSFNKTGLDDEYMDTVPKKSDYGYDKNGNVILAGIKSYFFDNKSQLINMTIKRNCDEVYLFKYDNNANISQMSMVSEKTYDHTTNECTYDTTNTYYHYNDKKLVDEEKIIEKKKLARLTKYEYEYFE
ncbi:MAG: hypothetical protein ABI921_03035 [Panacibacter sp.]